jgi:enterochelin esterase-like enzyme
LNANELTTARRVAHRGSSLLHTLAELTSAAVALAALLAAGLAACGAASPPHTESASRVDRRVIPAPSLHGGGRDVLLRLPPSYSRAESVTRRYPVIILLHGEPGSNADWPNRCRIAPLLDELETSGAIPEVIVIMPDADGPGPGARSLYVNSDHGRFAMEDFIVRDVVDWADSALRTRPEASQRALVGVSDGANAALNLAFKHPDRFGACAGHSGEYEWKPFRGMESLLGSEPEASAILKANSPVLYARGMAHRLRGLSIYFDAGVLDFAFLDDRRLDDELTAARVQHVYREYWGWHDWPFWRRRLLVSLPYVTRHMR